MTNYRRHVVPGGSYFFTANLADRRQRLLVENIDLLRTAFRYVRLRHSFTIDAIVVLPEHLHTIWTLPDGDGDFALRWQLIKAYFSRELPEVERVSASRTGKRERGIWQRRYWEHTIRDEDDYARHVDYLHYNPIKHGHVERMADWPYSSYHRLVRLGLYLPDGPIISDDQHTFVERL
ncbi:MAG TPA: transposase [Stellaceae bacterium]|nr:transposase [Stellaceae bacterium]